MALSTDDNEYLFDALAQAIDRVGPLQAPLLLSKLVLLLANRIGERSVVDQALSQAQMHLDAPR